MDDSHFGHAHVELTHFFPEKSTIECKAAAGFENPSALARDSDLHHTPAVIMLGTRHQRYKSFDLHLPRKASFASLRRMASYTQIAPGQIKYLEPTEHCVSPPPKDPATASPVFNFNSPDDIKGCVIDPLKSPLNGSKEEKPVYSTSPSLLASRRPQTSIAAVTSGFNNIQIRNTPSTRHTKVKRDIKDGKPLEKKKQNRRSTRDPYKKRILSPVDDGGFPEVVFSSVNESTVSLELFRSDSLAIPPLSRFSIDTESSFEDETVTPLHLLSDQPDWVDCPFCLRRVETRVRKDPSRVTHIANTGLFIATLGMSSGTTKKKNWKCHITHICSNCDRTVAHQHYGKRMEALGTPRHLREASKYVGGLSISSSTRTSASHEVRRPYDFF